MILQSPDHLAVDEGGGGRVLDLELDSPGAAHDAQVETSVFLEDGARIVGRAAGTQDRQGTLAEQGVQSALARIEKLGDFLLGKILEAPLRRDSGIDHVGRKDRGLHAPSYG